MVTKYKCMGVAVCCLVLTVVLGSSLGSLGMQPESLQPAATLNLGGSKVNGFISTADGKYVFAALSVGRESSVFLSAVDTSLKFYGKKIRGCPIEGEICLVQIRGNINPQDIAYNESKQTLFIPGFDDDTLYFSQVVFDKDGKPTEARAAKKVAVGLGPRAVAVNDQGTRVFTVNERAHTVSVVDVLYTAAGAPDKGEVIATINLDPDEENPQYPSPADVMVSGDKAYVVYTDTWKVCEITNINADSEKVKKGEEKIEVGSCANTGAYPRAMAMMENSAYVINSVGDSVSQVSLGPIESVKEVAVGDAPRGITTDGKCWVVVTNTGVDKIEDGGASVTLLNKDLTWSKTLLVEPRTPGDPIVPTQVQLIPYQNALAMWVLNIGARGEIYIYQFDFSTCPSSP